MEGRSPNNNAATPLRSTESRQQSFDVPTSFGEMPAPSDNSYDDINQNVTNASRSIGSNSIAGISESSFSPGLHGDCGPKRKTPDGSSEDNRASTSTVKTRDRQCQVTAAHDIPSQTVNSSGPSISQGQASQRESTSRQMGISNLASPPEYSHRSGRSRRRQRNVTRSSTSHDTLVTNNATAQGSRGPTETNMGSGGEVSIRTGATGNTFLQRLRPTARRREMMAQALPATDNVPVHLESTPVSPVHLESTPVSPVVNVPPIASSTIAEYHGPSFPSLQQQTFYVHNSEGINLAVVLNFDEIHVERPQNNQMLNLGGISNEEMNRLVNQARINTRLSEEAILQGLNPRRYRLGETKAEEEEEICCICLDELGNEQDLAKLECGHDFHFDCIKQWLAEKNCCPACKMIAIDP